MSEPVRTRPFAPFEWLLSGRYLRARRKEGFISVIAGFSFLGIMLGVATLIIVMAVMNGFRKELLDKILGLNGHLLVQPLESPLTDWKDVADRISQVPGIRLAAPVVDGQGLGSSPFNAAGVFIRGIRADDLNNLTSISKNIKQGAEDTDAASEKLYRELTAKGVDVLYDDTDQRAGAKFAAADLIGIPWQILVGPKGLAEGKVEIKRRSDGMRENLSPAEVLARLSA